MRRKTAVILGVSGAALALTASSAFTATGLTNNAGATAVIGGTAEQTVSGATLSTLEYTFDDTANTKLKKVTATFADATGGKTPTIAVTGTKSQTSATWSCQAIDSTTFKSECSISAGWVTDTTKVEITVS